MCTAKGELVSHFLHRVCQLLAANFVHGSDGGTPKMRNFGRWAKFRKTRISGSNSLAKGLRGTNGNCESIYLVISLLGDSFWAYALKSSLHY